MAEHYVYSFRAELCDYKPKIWRRFEINGERTMAELGYAIMLMFEMRASHMFCFRESSREPFLAELRARYSEEEVRRVCDERHLDKIAINIRYELPDYDETCLPGVDRLVAANGEKLSQINREAGWTLTFEYDYDDGWEINLVLERCEKRLVSLAELPRVTEGGGYGIVEDVGGVGGLASLARALKKGKGRKYDEYREWLDAAALNLESFDMDDINFRLKKLLRVYKGIYEYQHEPAEKSRKLLFREPKGKRARKYCCEI